MGFRRMLALCLSAMMLLTPVTAPAEAYALPAGELAATTLADSYYGGYQVNAQFGFDVDTAELSSESETLKAAAVLLEKANVTLSFYDDFGTARIRAAMSLDGVDVFSGDMLIFEDGSVQLVTNLTGNIAFTLPAGTVSEDGIALPQIEALAVNEYNDTSAFENLKRTTPNMISTVINLLLGWVSATQMETGELYTFDYDNYIEATEKRDAVASRMIGKIRSQDFSRFVWNIITHIRDKEHDFQAALAMCIGKMGLTRYNGRQIIDALFPNQVVDPEIYFIQPSEEIEDTPALFMYDDLRYLLCKLDLCLFGAWAGDEIMDTTSSMIVSYDDFGAMVGFDAELAKFSKAYPYEGNFTYSIKTDDDWQRMHSAHGEMQVTDSQRVLGDLDMKLGEDVDGVKASYLRGQMDLVDQKDGSAIGFGLDTALEFALTPEDDGENIQGNADVMLNINGEGTMLVDTDLSAAAKATELGLALTGTLDVRVQDMPKTTITVGIDCVEYDEAPYQGGQALDLTGEISDAQLEEIKNTVTAKAAALALKFALKPTVTGNALKLMESFGE